MVAPSTAANSKPNGAQSNYIAWNAKGVEVIQPGEAEKIKAVSEQFQRFQQKNFKTHHHMFRGTHVKTQGCVKGKFIVKSDLPDHLAQGMFKTPGSYDMIMRYSSLTPKILPDTAGAPRGIGMKIFGVKGEKLWGEDKETQDWTANNYPILELRTPQATNEIADSLERNWNDGEKFVEELKARPDADVACYAGGLAQEHMAAMDQYSQAAYRYGDYVAKFVIRPTGEEQIKLKSWSVKPTDAGNVLSTTLQEFHQNHRATYSFQVQLLQDLEAQPVDDIGILWDEKKYPFVEVATLEFEPQDSWIHSFRNWWDDRITCNSWHGLIQHQPLGSTNRMRRVVYAESRMHRMKVNATTCIEPKGLDEVPA